MRIIVVYNTKKRKLGLLPNALEEVIQGIAEAREDLIYCFVDLILPNRPWTD